MGIDHTQRGVAMVTDVAMDTVRMEPEVAQMPQVQAEVALPQLLTSLLLESVYEVG